MGYDLKTAERVRRILSGRGDVMCCGVTSTGLMVRVGADARDQVLAEPHVRPMEFAGRSLAGFVCIEPLGFRTDKQLAAWVQRGIDFAASLPAKKR
jgi:hypothetical protein